MLYFLLIMRYLDMINLKIMKIFLLSKLVDLSQLKFFHKKKKSGGNSKYLNFGNKSNKIQKIFVLNMKQ